MPKLRDYLQLHFIVWIWGFTAILGLLITIPAVELVFYRTVMAASLLGLLTYWRGFSFFVGRREILKILATGSLIALHWILFFGAARVSTASVCLAGMATSSLWTSLLEPIIYKRKIKSFEIILGLVVIAGLYVVFLFEVNHVLGLFMAVVSALLGALFTVINGRLINNHHHYLITFYEMIGALIFTTLFLPINYYLSPVPLSTLIPSLLDWFYIGILAFVCTVYAYTISVKLMNKFTPFAINLTVNLEPVYGIVLAFLIFGQAEKMTSGFYIGTLIILIAVLCYPYLNNHFTKMSKLRNIRKIRQRKVASATNFHILEMAEEK